MVIQSGETYEQSGTEKIILEHIQRTVFLTNVRYLCKAEEKLNEPIWSGTIRYTGLM